MTERKHRDYELVIGYDNSAVIVKPPMRIVFSCTKSLDGQGVNKMIVSVYNLKKDTRLQLVKDAEDANYIPFRLSVGYNKDIETIFKGSVFVGSNKFAAPDHITTLESLDGGYDFLNSNTAATIKGNAGTAINRLLTDMPNTSIGKITSMHKLSRPKVMVGNPFDIIEKMIEPDTTWYIDNEQLYIIRDDETTTQYIPIISAQTGLLNTPERQNRIVTCQTMLNHSLRIGGRCELKSETAPHLNAVYRISTIEYKGDYEGQDWIQSITMIADTGYTVL